MSVWPLWLCLQILLMYSELILSTLFAATCILIFVTYNSASCLLLCDFSLLLTLFYNPAHLALFSTHSKPDCILFFSSCPQSSVELKYLNKAMTMVYRCNMMLNVVFVLYYKLQCLTIIMLLFQFFSEEALGGLQRTNACS